MNSDRGEFVALPVDEGQRSAFVGKISEAVVAHGHGAGAVFETALDGRAVRVYLRPSDLLPPPSGTPVRGTRETVGRWALHRRWDLRAAYAGERPRPSSIRPLRARELLLAASDQVRIRTTWLPGRADRRLWAARTVWVRGGPPSPGPHASESWISAVEEEWSARVLAPVRAVRRRGGRTTPAPFEGARRGPRAAWFPLEPARAIATVDPILFAPSGGALWTGGHVGVFGATGAGKTWFLAQRAARAVGEEAAVVAVDLHGDLGPAIASRLAPRERERLVAVDVEERPVLGLAALAGSEERAAGHLVAAVKRLTPDGADLYWGFRLERIFDAFVRLVLESGGTVLDLYGLLTDPDRREVARLATRRPELARFLDELAPIVRRSPDFLWPAAARLSKVALLPALAELLAPRDGGLDVERLLEEGRALLVRLPFGRLGAEAASLAGSLVLARVYYGMVARCSHGGRRPVVVVLDEVHGLSPRLVTEMLTEGRKFGFRLFVASQYPDRLAPELRAAVAGTVRDLVVFRTPTSGLAGVGAWLGLPPTDAAVHLTSLPTGSAIARTPAGELVGLAPPDRSEPRPEPWAAAVLRARKEFDAVPAPEDLGEEAVERLLLAVLAAEEEGTPLRYEELAGAAGRQDGAIGDPVELSVRAVELERRGLFARHEGRVVLTAAGARQIGLRTATGATRESDEHRALLVRAFRLFARRGCRLEIVRQGRYDTTLPDGRFRQLGTPDGRSPRELAAAIERARAGWAWRCFGGRDVFLEAEVSGALRPERIRHGVRKALARGAFPLFVVADAPRARRVRRTLRSLGLGPRDAQVWTLSERSLPEVVPTRPLGPAGPDPSR